MKHARNLSILSVTAGCLASFGCQSIQRVTYRPSPPVAPSVVLATDFGPQQEQPPANASKKPVAPVGDQDDKKKDTTTTKKPGGSPVISTKMNTKGQRKRLPYTPPPIAMMLTIGMTAAQSQDDAQVAGGGREAAEGNISTSSAVVGRPGLAPPRSVVTGAVVGRPGLQRGAATALGSSNPFNVLTPQVNPLTGATGRCQDLVNAGFFGSSLPSCVAHFRR